MLAAADELGGRIGREKCLRSTLSSSGLLLSYRIWLAAIAYKVTAGRQPWARDYSVLEYNYNTSGPPRGVENSFDHNKYVIQGTVP